MTAQFARTIFHKALTRLADPHLLPQQRTAILRKWHYLILEAREDLALLMTLEQGKPLSASRGEINYAASFVELHAEEGKRLNAENVTSHMPGTEMIVRREALGVAGIRLGIGAPVSRLRCNSTRHQEARSARNDFVRVLLPAKERFAPFGKNRILNP